jgi:hypothetical protein
VPVVGCLKWIKSSCKLALKAGQTQGLRQIDARIIQQIGSRFDCVSKAVPPERRDRVRDASPLPQETLVTSSPKEGAVSPAPPIPEASFVPAQEPSSHPPIAVNVDEGTAHGVSATDPRGMPPLLADIIEFPETIYLKAKNLPGDQRLKLAGQLAAEVLKRYPHLIQQLGSTTDPVPVWTILRDIVMRQLEQHLAIEPPSISQAL